MTFPTIRPKCTRPGCTNNAMPAGYGKFKKECTTHHKEKYGIDHTSNQKDRFRKKGNRNLCIACGWTGRCDMHRRTMGAKGGTYKKSNVRILCPNCHKIVHLLEMGAEITKDTCSVCGWVGPCDVVILSSYGDIRQIICPNCRRLKTPSEAKNEIT